jgi:hypothetical protein
VIRFKALAGATSILALVALVVAGSASAAGGTTVCKVNETPCSAANHYAPGSKFKAVSGTMTLKRTWSGLTETITCNSSDLSGQLVSTGSSSGGVEAQITSLRFVECVLGSSACENYSYANLGTPWKGIFNNTAGTMNGTLALSNGATGLKILTRCPQNGTECLYTASSATLEVLGGEKGSLVATKQQLKGSSPSCAPLLDWDANYTIVEPTPFYLAQSL